MKKIITLSVLVTLLLSCSSNTPKNTAKHFSENIAKGKIEEAKKYCTEATGKLLDFASSLATVPVYPNYKFEFIKDSIVDNKAWITYKNEKDKESTLELVKIDDKWLVHHETKK